MQRNDKQNEGVIRMYVIIIVIVHSANEEIAKEYAERVLDDLHNAHEIDRYEFYCKDNIGTPLILKANSPIGKKLISIGTKVMRKHFGDRIAEIQDRLINDTDEEVFDKDEQGIRLPTTLTSILMKWVSVCGRNESREPKETWVVPVEVHSCDGVSVVKLIGIEWDQGQRKRRSIVFKIKEKKTEAVV